MKIYEVNEKPGGYALHSAGVQRINKGHIKPTIEYLSKITGIPVKELTPLGSTGKMKTSGDIDIGIEKTRYDYEDIHNKLCKLLGQDKCSYNQGTHVASYAIPIMRKNKNKELVKIPKIYFLDNGVRNFFINNFNKVDLRDDSGFLFESFVMQELLKNDIYNLKFWQDKQKHEVDFVIDLVSKQIPVEVKFKRKIKHEDLIGMNTFLDMHKSTKSYIVNIGNQIVKNKIKLISPFKLERIFF